MEIFDEFIVVDEKVISLNLLNCSNCNGTFCEVTQFAALEFKKSFCSFLQIRDIGIDSKPNEEPLAQIVRWNWDQNGAQQIKDTLTLNRGGGLSYKISGNDNALLHSFIIRILKKREKKSDENAFPAPSKSSTDNDELTVKIGDKQIAVSAHWLSSVSPVISRMLSVEMKEKQQRMITLDELGVDMDQFMEFLEAICGHFLPNPKNVLVLLKLADYFQVTVLKSRCETHLINCVEIPLIDRFLLIERFGLDKFKNYFLHLNIDNFRAFFKANNEKLLPVVTALKSRCELHLINCVEIPLIDRFLLIERFGLDNLKNYFLNLDVNKFRAFFVANNQRFLPVISKEFLCALSVRLCG